MKQELITNLFTSTRVTIEEANNLLEIIKDQPNSQYTQSRRDSIMEKIGNAKSFLKVLRMVTCDHSESTTGIAWIKDYADIYHREKIRSIKQVTKRCKICNIVFYRKTYDLLKKKSGSRVKKIK